MAAGDTLQGRRRTDGTGPHDMAAGDYAWANDEHTALWLCAPDGQPGRVESPTWTIAEEANGSITVEPSIWWDKPTGWHGFLRRGVWEQV